MSSLEAIELSSNTLSGTLPLEIGNMKALQVLSLANNAFIGEIPSTIGELSNLLYLSLASNKLNGELPSSMCNLKSLRYFFLSNNSFEGTMPQCFGNFSKFLWFLHVNANHLSGPIPSTFSKNLQSINLSGNKLHGRLPKSLIDCKSLEGLDVGSNAIQDTFPFWMETLPLLRVLALRSNKCFMVPFCHSLHPAASFHFLSCKFWIFLGMHLWALYLKYIYFNNFRAMIEAKENQSEGGPYLDSFVQMRMTLKGEDQLLERLLAAFTIIDVSSNKFSGAIPHSIGILKSLKYLNFSHNNLTGNIPSSLRNMSELESLDLSANRLDGKIPSELTRLTFLSKLNLSMNNLMGEIPRSKQFLTFENDSYIGNSRLCGVPLIKKCREEENTGQPMQPEEDKSDDDSKLIDGFSWRSVAMGYGSGFAVGIGIGCCIIRFGSPRWLVEFFFGVGYKYNYKMKRRNGATTKQRRS